MNNKLKALITIEIIIAYGPLLIILPGTLGTSIIWILLDDNVFTYYLLITSVTGLLGILGLLIVFLKIIDPTFKGPHILITISLITCGLFSLLFTYFFLSVAGNYAFILLIPLVVALHLIYLWVKLIKSDDKHANKAVKNDAHKASRVLP